MTYQAARNCCKYCFNVVRLIIAAAHLFYWYSRRNIFTYLSRTSGGECRSESLRTRRRGDRSRPVADDAATSEQWTILEISIGTRANYHPDSLKTTWWGDLHVVSRFTAQQSERESEVWKPNATSLHPHGRSNEVHRNVVSPVDRMSSARRYLTVGWAALTNEITGSFGEHHATRKRRPGRWVGGHEEWVTGVRSRSRLNPVQALPGAPPLVESF